MRDEQIIRPMHDTLQHLTYNPSEMTQSLIIRTEVPNGSFKVKPISVVDGSVDKIEAKFLFQILYVDINGCIIEINFRAPDVAQQVFL